MNKQKLSDALADSFYKGKMAERARAKDAGIILKTKKALDDGPPFTSTVSKLRF